MRKFAIKIINMITNIKIENIKGFGTTNNSFDLEIKPRKVNILVAPNGFGKSSITAAFNSLAKGKSRLKRLICTKRIQPLFLLFLLFLTM